MKTKNFWVGWYHHRSSNGAAHLVEPFLQDRYHGQFAPNIGGNFLWQPWNRRLPKPQPARPPSTGTLSVGNGSKATQDVPLRTLIRPTRVTWSGCFSGRMPRM